MKNKTSSLLVIFSIIAVMVVSVSAGVQSEETAAADYSNPAELYSLVESQDEEYILVDVRTAEEFAMGHIPTSGNIPFDIIDENLPSDNREDLIIVYCRSGRRSSIAANSLAELGFSNVVDFGGVSNWPGELAN
jgi:rhodanese-related sulfurtransferase